MNTTRANSRDMDAAEFIACRETLGLSPNDLAAELGITPHVLSAIERGDVRVPKSFARELAWRTAIIRRDAFLTSAGYPPCPLAIELEKTFQPALAAQNTEELTRLGHAITAHVEGCPTCGARKHYADKYAPPLPEPPLSLPVRALGGLNDRLDRLPGVLRPPPGEGGDARRLAVGIAALFSLLAVGIAVIAAIAGLASGRWGSDWWKEPLAIVVVVPVAYLVGFYLAGWAIDATRPIRHRFLGYVVRGALSVAAVYGTIGLCLPLLDPEPTLKGWPQMTAFFSALGAAGGALLWMIHRVRGKIPRRDA